MSSARARIVLGRLAAAALAALAALALAEILLRARASEAGYFVRPPHLVATLHPRADLMPGVDGPSRFATSSLGLRGRELAADAGPRVLAIGGSTTECLYLDQAETWPALLEAELGPRAWVGNAGRSGHTTREHRLQADVLLAEPGRFDVALVLAGVNDLCKRLAQAESYDPRWLDSPAARGEVLRDAFALLPAGADPSRPWFERLHLWRAAQSLTRGVPTQDPEGTIYVQWRAHRAGAAEIRDALPDLDGALAEYRENLASIAARARAAGVRLVLLSQPALWRADLEPELARLCWLGGVGRYQSEPGAPYYSIAALAEGLARYDAALAEVAQEQGVAFLDLAALVPRDTSAFYDDVHFNENGARLVAAAVARFLRDQGLAGEGTPP